MAKKTDVPDDGRVTGSVRQLKLKSISLDDRQRRREVALKYRPWQYATGPRTPEGKARVAENGRYAQKDAVSRRQREKEVAEARTLLAQMTALRRIACPDASPTAEYERD
jgi:hypothetical protein